VTNHGIAVRIVGVERFAASRKCPEVVLDSNVRLQGMRGVRTIVAMGVAHVATAGVPHALEILDGFFGNQSITDVHLACAQLMIAMGEHAAHFIRTLTMLEIVAAHLRLVALGQYVSLGAHGSLGGVVIVVVVRIHHV